MAALEARGSRDYYQIADPSHSLYSKEYAKDQLDSNPIQADLVNMVSILDPDYADTLIQHNYFDIGANDFVLSATNEYFRARDK